jgi:hypothetical protein
LFDDKIFQGDGPSSNHSIDDDDVFVEVPFAMEPHFVFVDPILTQENVEVTKKQKKAYELNMHF